MSDLVYWLTANEFKNILFKQNIGCWQTAMEIMGVIGVMVNCALIGNKISLPQFISMFSNFLTQDCPGRCTACSRPWQPPRRCSWSSCWSTSCSSSSSSSRPLSPTLHITWHKLVKMCHWRQFVSLFDIRNLRGRNTEDARWRDWCQVSGWQISSQRSVLPLLACSMFTLYSW